MNKVLVIGLGVIGASFSYALKRKNYYIYGVDKDSETIKYALNKGIINEGSIDIEEFLNKADIIILAVYPKDVYNILENYKFNKKQIVTDVSGVKEELVNIVNDLDLECKYVSIHPMAGREKSGIMYADASRFIGANFLIIPTNKTDDLAIEEMKKLAKALDFGNISIITADYHDKMIALTSQLPHALAVALVLANDDENTVDFIGDSYRDLTRIAMINHKLWQELFKENKNNLIKNIENLTKKLDNIKDCLKNDDYVQLEEMFKQSTIKRELMNKKKVAR